MMREGVVFVHIPKNAGCSLDKCIGELVSTVGHDTRDENYKFLREHHIPETWFCFCFSRNPWDRVVSAYFFLKNHGHPEHPQDADDFNLYFGAFDTFRDTLLGWDDKFYEQIHFRPQYQWICDGDGKLIPDFIGKVENLQEDFNTVCDKIGIPRQQLPHANKTKHKHYTEYYDDETKQIVAEKYAKDIEYFGYEFGG
jgi:chondroitin 4-sulfotransferase 11